MTILSQDTIQTNFGLLKNMWTRWIAAETLLKEKTNAWNKYCLMRAAKQTHLFRMEDKERLI